ncbi:MAG: hydrogenase maturation nickel metallochaperone HypA [Pseudomonadota bacterium]|jgi:hydrogenase nickel incorporation protein HypA/HybF
MHELSLCEHILQTLQQQAQIQSYSQVKKVCLTIGTLAYVEIEAMRFCFEVVMKNTLAEQAILEIIEIQAQAWCKNCQQFISVNSFYDSCPYCAAIHLEIVEGCDMKIQYLEVI